MGEIDRWANIHLDLLNELVKRIYSYNDYIRLRLVCKEWNSKILKILDNKRSPWLVLPGIIDNFETMSLQEEEIYHLILPELQDNLVCGSCCGWLIYVMMSNGILRMLNPFNKTHFDLAPISTFPEIIEHNPDNHGYEYTILDLDDDTTCTVEKNLQHRREVWKVVISSCPDDDNDEFMAVAIYGQCKRLAFYKRNDRGWTDIPTSKRRVEFQDVILFHKKIYAIDWDAQLYEFDTKTKPLPVGGICEAVSPAAFRHQIYYASMNKYLIGCEDGSLLLLVRYFVPDGSHETGEFDIFILDKDAKGWSKIHSLGNYTLMIGHNSSVRMPAHTFPGSRWSHIYYTDNLLEFHDLITAQYQDVGIFNLKDRTKKKLLSTVKFLRPPVWLLP